MDDAQMSVKNPKAGSRIRQDSVKFSTKNYKTIFDEVSAKMCRTVTFKISPKLYGIV